MKRLMSPRNRIRLCGIAAIVLAAVGIAWSASASDRRGMALGLALLALGFYGVLAAPTIVARRRHQWDFPWNSQRRPKE